MNYNFIKIFNYSNYNIYKTYNMQTTNFFINMLSLFSLIPSILYDEDDEIYSGNMYPKNYKFTGDEFKIYDYSCIPCTF